MDLMRALELTADIPVGQPFTLVYQDEAPFLKRPAKKANLSGIMTKTAINVKFGYGERTSELIRQYKERDRQLDRFYRENPDQKPEDYIFLADRYGSRNYSASWENGLPLEFSRKYGPEIPDHDFSNKYVCYGSKVYLCINADKEEDQKWRTEYDINLNGVDMHLNSLSPFGWALSQAKEPTGEERPWRAYIPIAVEKVVSINGRS